MSQRKQALGRVWTAIWLFTIGYLIAIVISVIAMVWGTVDLIWSFITGRNDLSETARPAQWVDRTFTWSAGQTIYVFTGGGDGRWKALP